MINHLYVQNLNEMDDVECYDCGEPEEEHVVIVMDESNPAWSIAKDKSKQELVDYAEGLLATFRKVFPNGMGK